MLQLERVIFSEGLLKIPPVLLGMVTEDVLNVAAAYYSYKIQAEHRKEAYQLQLISNSLKTIDTEKDKDLYDATKDWFVKTRRTVYELEGIKERVLDPVSTKELGDFESHIKNGYFLLRYPLTEELFSRWYPGGKEAPLDLKNILTTTEYQKQNDSSPTLVCFIGFLGKYQGKSHQGLYHNASNLGVYMINIPLPYIENWQKSENELENIVDYLPTTIEHELGHFVQELFQLAKTNVPHREKRYRKFGYPSKTIQQPGDEYAPNKDDWADPHGLRDIEFYTRLADARTNLIKGLEKYKTNWNFERFKAFVGASQDTENFEDTDPWLKILKDKAPGKYKKAVAELYKAVRDEYLP